MCETLGPVPEHGTDLTTDFCDRPGTAFVIGGSGGLGAAVCRELAVRGSDVALTYRGNEEAAQLLAADISEWGRRAWAVALDLTDHAAAKASVDAIPEAAGGIHTLVYAAGPTVPQKHLSRVDPGEVRWQLDADAAGFFAVAQPANTSPPTAGPPGRTRRSTGSPGRRSASPAAPPP